jgi:hypothetical protein
MAAVEIARLRGAVLLPLRCSAGAFSSSRLKIRSPNPTIGFAAWFRLKLCVPMAQGAAD